MGDGREPQVIGLISRWNERVSRLSTAARCARLNAALLVVLVAALAFVALTDGGAAGFAAIVIAFGVCAVSSNAALWIAMLGHGTPNGVSGALGGSIFGMIPPLVVGLVLHQRGGPLAESGVLAWIGVFYLTGLVVKTLLLAPTAGTLVSRPVSPGGAPSKAGA
jgi:hypothetical protein